MIMKAEKLIKEKLDELNEIPEGFHFDQADTWKRIQMRLDEESSLTRLKRAIFGLFADDGDQQPNRRRSRKGLNGKKGFDQK